MKDIAVIGAGAVGGFYGAKLQNAGYNLEYYSKYLKSPLKIQSIWGDFEVNVKVFSNPSKMKKADLILICNKVIHPFKDSNFIFELIQPILKKESILLFLQNGINMEEIFSKKIKNPILGGLAFTCINRTKPNLIKHIDYGKVTIGAVRDKDKILARNLTNLWMQSGIDTIYTDNLRKSRFEKLLWNIPFNSLSVLGQTNTQKLIQNEFTKEYAFKLMKEVQSIARAEKIKIPTQLLKDLIERTEKMKPYKTSMLLDYESNKQLEIEPILGECFRMSKEYNLKTPHLNSLYAIMSLYK
jgi:2-dehydropantoate 2-reductase